MVRKWLLLILLPLLIQEMQFLSLFAQGPWSQLVVSGGLGDSVEGQSGDVSWRAYGGGTGSGGDVCGVTVAWSGGKLVWSGGQNIGEGWVLISSEEAPRFLVYQPILGWTTNHRLLEEPERHRPGLWLLAPGPQGYEKQAVVTNPVSLLARNPKGVWFTSMLFVTSLLE